MLKHICMVAYTQYSTDSRVRREAETLAARGNTVLVLSLTEDSYPKTYGIMGVTIKELPVKKYVGNNRAWHVLSYIEFLFLATAACTNLLLRGQIDVIHVHNMPNFLVFAGIIPRIVGKKMILDIHDSMPETFTGKFGGSSGALYKILCLEELLCSALSHRVICVNHIQRNVLVKRGIPQGKITTLLNVPDGNIFSPDNKGLISRKKAGRFNLVYHGTIENILGIDLAIRAVAYLIKQIPRLQFHIFGSGRDLNELCELSKNLGLERHINFSRRFYPLDDLPNLLRGMDIGIISNRKNSATDLMLPVKMLEYIALGIPVVAPRLRAIEYYFSEDMVGYYDPENVTSMINAILRIYNDKKRARRQTHRAKTFLDRYGWKEHQKELIRLYADL